MNFLFRLFFLFSFCHSLHSFVPQKTIIGESFTWETNRNLEVFLNPSNSSAISDNNVIIRTQSSAAQWNSAEGPSLQVRSTTSSPQPGRNDIYFSNSAAFFSGNSILAVTESVYNEASGRIIESDIILKDSILFSNNPLISPYIGDVLSHEMGHLIGLDHSSLPFSSMFYKLTRGQHSISSDDLLGKQTLYNRPSFSGVITGRVAGGSSATGIFGADVQLISSNTGSVIASTLTDESGYFSFRGVKTEDTYYLFIAPVKVKNSLSPFYETIKTDFCTGFSNFRGGFFKSCDSSREGYPQGINLSNTIQSIDIGTITIKCGLDVPLNYLSNRGGTFELDSNSSKKGDSFVGFFTQAEVDSNSLDEVLIDLSDLDASGGNLFLDLKLLSQEFYSKVSFSMEVSSPSSTYNFNFSVDDDSNPHMNLSGKIPLDPSVFGNNVFRIKITPTDFQTFKSSSGFSLDSFFFPDGENAGENRLFYQFIYFVSQRAGAVYSPFGHYDYGAQRGNLKCMEGSKTYSVKAAGAVTGVTLDSFNKRKSSDSAVACGSVSVGGGPPGGGNALIVAFGFLLALSLSRVKKTV